MHNTERNTGRKLTTILTETSDTVTHTNEAKIENALDRREEEDEEEARRQDGTDQEAETEEEKGPEHQKKKHGRKPNPVI